MLLVKESLKFQMGILQKYTLFFVDKMWVSFAMKRILIFCQQKITMHLL